jgi:hypothetical protein
MISHTDKGVLMPKVGKKEFPYNAKGMAMAKAEAKKTGMKMDSAKKAPVRKAKAKKKK